MANFTNCLFLFFATTDNEVQPALCSHCMMAEITTIECRQSIQSISNQNPNHQNTKCYVQLGVVFICNINMVHKQNLGALSILLVRFSSCKQSRCPGRWHRPSCPTLDYNKKRLQNGLQRENLEQETNQKKKKILSSQKKGSHLNPSSKFM